jgi:ubiquinone/menaquinone biosynthesis C-methylase UbiE
MGDERNTAPSDHLQAMIPSAATDILDLGCGAGDWSARIASQRPWTHVTGVDIGKDFISAASERHGCARVSFCVADFAALPFSDSTFDCVYADNSLEHAWDVDATLREVRRVLRPNGVLVAAIPSDARNPDAICDNHTWKTEPWDVWRRLTTAGLSEIEIDERDLYREMGQPPFPPSRDQMMFVAAWRSGASDD